MRTVFFILLVMVLGIVSCNRTNPAFLILPGTYTGTFQRGPGYSPVSTVTITFSPDGNWAGQSQFPHYPALCSGTYKMSSSHAVSFKNACPWTADFNWTLILSGDYNITISGSHIEITRDYASLAKDVYDLTLQ